ncbi:hypothetical protein AB0958_20400 [Streptomyces sp. NPDC006655]|uniref:hypothetical protein n=1 Tax=Streptomyces sp. NPDC006655 TaxID=3156898 RepID=UPI003454039C
MAGRRFLAGWRGPTLAVHGWPQWFQVALAVIELGLPPVFFWLADAEERTLRSDVEVTPGGESA